LKDSDNQQFAISERKAQMSTDNTFGNEDFLEIFYLAIQVILSLQDEEVDDRFAHSGQLVDKILNHAATIYWLRQGTKIPTISSPIEVPSFYDFASTAVIARATLETYLKLYEVFIKPNIEHDEDEFEFNYHLWQLQGYILREKAQQLDSNEVQEKTINIFKSHIVKTKKYQSLKPGKQKEIFKGRALEKDWVSLAKILGFDADNLRRVYADYSGIAHADGISCFYITEAKTQQQIDNVEDHVTLVMKIIFRMIGDFVNLFPETTMTVCDNNSFLKRKGIVP
jgi:hypothetical protein